MRIMLKKSYFIFVYLLFFSSLVVAETNKIDPLINKKFPVAKKMEISTFVLDATLRNIYVKNNYALHLGVGYHFFDFLLVEVYGGYVFSQNETNIIQYIRLGMANVDLSPLPLWQTEWFTGVNVNFAPFYGKLSLFSEAELYLQTYFLLGAALEGIFRVVGVNTNLQKDLRFAANFGLGLSILLTDAISLRAEIKQSLGFKPLKETRESNLTYGTWFQLGVSYLFDLS